MAKEPRFFDRTLMVFHTNQMPGPAHYEPVELNTKRRLLKIGCYKIREPSTCKAQHI